MKGEYVIPGRRMAEQRDPGLTVVTDWLLLSSMGPLQTVVQVVYIAASEERVVTKGGARL